MASTKKYYWLKLMNDFFDSKRIKKLRRMAGGDTYTIIYLKMQLLSLKRGGILEYTGLEDEFYKELALDLSEDEVNVQATVLFLLSCGLLETSDNITFSLPFVKKNLGSESASAQRVRAYRARKKELLESNQDVIETKQSDNAEIGVDKEIKKENIEIRKRIIEYLNQKAGTQYKYNSANTVKHINARLAENYTEEDFYTVIDKKSNEWIGTQWEKYLQPSTLFGSKFEGYLNQKNTIKYENAFDGWKNA